MKARLILAVILTLCCIAGCSNDQQNGPAVSAKNLLVGNCAHSVNTKASVFPDQRIYYKALGNRTLQLKAEALLFNCNITGVNIEVTEEKGNQIFIHYKSVGEESANCICPRDLSCEIDGLTEGVTYQMVFRVNNLGYTSFSLPFTKDAEGVVEKGETAF